ncbi:MAG: hypothetical protein LPJ89_02455 [Hymenobacteraceae bacterium]|nr:hypothetical protein [Hymenobacteraceae bacterium]MDX5397583.1 hypothetical protein [Hymenobacteraceae bacterium]MDX5442627.1 hypothetical protein [Hymenobacteraceae bacterium]MDX5513663.1 hypothetical protein [Hymenobacteraceae bacterium]
MANYTTGRLSLHLLQNKALLFCLVLYAGYYVCSRLGLQHPVLTNYLNDVLCMPLVLSAALLYQRIITYRNAAYVFTGYHVIVAVVYYAVAFELVLPQFMPRYTADFYDVVAYAAGGWLYYRFINKAAVAPAAALK